MQQKEIILMPVRKRTHTTISDGFPAHINSQVSQTGRLIAAEAALIMATQARYNYRITKQKAAQRPGIKAPLSPMDGRPQKRAPLSEVECLPAGIQAQRDSIGT